MTLLEAAEMALDAIEAHGGHLPFVVYRNVKGALRDALGQLELTHSDECYQWHHACAIAEILRLRAARGDDD